MWYAVGPLSRRPRLRRRPNHGAFAMPGLCGWTTRKRSPSGPNQRGTSPRTEGKFGGLDAIRRTDAGWGPSVRPHRPFPDGRETERGKHRATDRVRDRSPLSDQGRERSVKRPRGATRQRADRFVRRETGRFTSERAPCVRPPRRRRPDLGRGGSGRFGAFWRPLIAPRLRGVTLCVHERSMNPSIVRTGFVGHKRHSTSCRYPT